ncbi:MAG: hypothetical protein RLY78_3978 [Pseudomonadota bacterium]
MELLPDDALIQLASYFQALAEPSRLRILNLLRDGERSVGELARHCGCSLANVSRHLGHLAQQGLVLRESRGTSAYYRIADPAVYQLCDLVCGQIARQWAHQARRHAAFASPGQPAAEQPDTTDTTDAAVSGRPAGPSGQM